MPPMPKRTGRPPGRLSKAKIKAVKALTDDDMAKLLLTADQLGAIFLSKEYSPAHAAATLGWTLEEVEGVLEMPAAKAILLDAHNEFIQDYAKGRLRNMRKVGVTAANVEQRLMDIAMMDPKETKGNVDGQVKALRTLAESMGMFKNDDPLKGKSRAELEGFVARAAKMLPPSTEKPPSVQ